MSVDILLIIILILLLLITWYVVTKGQNHFLDKFTKKFSVVGTIFIPLGIFLTYKVFSLQLEALKRDATYKMIDRGWLDVNKKFTEYYKDCPNFIDSLYFDWQTKTLGLQNNMSYQTHNNDKWYAINYLSILIFQSWEDYITSSKIDETGANVWINNFLQWSNSKMLRKAWSVLKTNFAETTQEFGDYLFYISSVYVPTNETELNNLSKMVSESEKFKNILKKRFT